MNKNTKNSRILRAKRASEGLKELRGIWVTEDEEKTVKPKLRAMIKRMRG